MLNKQRVIELVKAHAITWGIPIGKIVLGSGAACVMHGIVDTTDDLDVDLDTDDMKAFLDTFPGTDTFEGICGDIYRFGRHVDIHPRAWNGDNTKIVDGIRVYTLDRLVEQYEMLSSHPERGDKAVADIDKLTAIHHIQNQEKNKLVVACGDHLREAYGHVALALASCLPTAAEFHATHLVGRIQRLFDAHDRVWYAELVDGNTVNLSRSRFEKRDAAEPESLDMVLRYKHHISDLSFTVNIR